MKDEAISESDYGGIEEVSEADFGDSSSHAVSPAPRRNGPDAGEAPVSPDASEVPVSDDDEDSDDDSGHSHEEYFHLDNYDSDDFGLDGSDDTDFDSSGTDERDYERFRHELESPVMKANRANGLMPPWNIGSDECRTWAPTDGWTVQSTGAVMTSIDLVLVPKDPALRTEGAKPPTRRYHTPRCAHTRRRDDRFVFDARLVVTTRNHARRNGYHLGCDQYCRRESRPIKTARPPYTFFERAAKKEA